MSRLTELASKATPRPWRESKRRGNGYPYETYGFEEDSERGYLVAYSRCDCGCDNWIEWEGETDSALLVALANHAEAIQRLWDAAMAVAHGYDGFLDELSSSVEALRDLCGEQVTQAVSDGVNPSEDTYGCSEPSDCVRREKAECEWCMNPGTCPTCGCKGGEEPYDKRWCVDRWHETNAAQDGR